MPVPDPDRLYPALYSPKADQPMEMQRLVMLKALVQSPLTSVGDYTYYDDLHDPTGFERNNILFHYGPERLRIGKYCSIASGVRFIMSAGNHVMSGVSTYPFPLIGGDWTRGREAFARRESRGDTEVGNDVWLGHDALVMPGVTIGDGAVVAARTVVTGDVPPYAIVAGNPARVVRQRFDDDEVARLQRLAWWDWPVDLVTRHLLTIMEGSVDDLEAAAAGDRTAPWSTESTAHTTASPADVYARYADVGSWPAWNGAVEAVRLDGPFAAGVAGDLTPPGQLPLPFRVVATDPARGYTSETDIAETVTLRTVAALHPSAEGGTEIVHRVELDGPAAEAFAKSFGPVLAAGVPATVQSLARACGSDEVR